VESVKKERAGCRGFQGLERPAACKLCRELSERGFKEKAPQELPTWEVEGVPVIEGPGPAKLGPK